MHSSKMVTVCFNVDLMPHWNLTSSLLCLFFPLTLIVKAKVLLSTSWPGAVWLTAVVFCLTRLCGGTVRTVPSHCHVPGGLLHHLHDRAVSVCHLHQWSPGCWGSLLYPLHTHTHTITWHLTRDSQRSISNIVNGHDTKSRTPCYTKQRQAVLIVALCLVKYM